VPQHIAQRYAAVITTLGRMAPTSIDWLSIAIGAIRPDRMVSISRLTIARGPPPQPRRSASRNSRAMVPSSLGVSRTAIVPMNTHFDRIGSTAGQIGNSERLSPK
jgi:hypothetical protein